MTSHCGPSFTSLPTRSFRKDPNSELVAVVSRDHGQTQAFAERHGGRWAGTDYEAILALADVDVVLTTTAGAAGSLADQPDARNV